MTTPEDFKAIVQKRELPLFKSSISGLLSILSDKNRTPEDICAHIEKDPLLYCRVLKLVNSPMYTPFGSNIFELKRTINVLGENALFTLISQIPPLKDSLLEEEIAVKTEYLKSAACVELTKKVLDRKDIKPTEEEIAYCYLERYGYVALANHFPELWSKIKVSATQSDISIETALFEQGFSPECLKESIFEAKLFEEVAPEIKEVSASCSVLSHHAIDNTLESQILTDFAQALGVPVSFLDKTVGAVKENILRSFKLESLSSQDKLLSPELSTTLLLTRGISALRLNFEALDIIKFSSTALDILHSSLECKTSTLYLVAKDEVKAVYGKEKNEKLGFLGSLKFKKAATPSNTFEVCLDKNSVIKLTHPQKVKNPIFWHQFFGAAKEVLLLPIAVNGKAVGLIYLDWSVPVSATTLQNEKINELIRQFILLINKKMDKALPK